MVWGRVPHRVSSRRDLFPRRERMSNIRLQNRFVGVKTCDPTFGGKSRLWGEGFMDLSRNDTPTHSVQRRSEDGRRDGAV